MTLIETIAALYGNNNNKISNNNTNNNNNSSFICHKHDILKEENMFSTT